MAEASNAADCGCGPDFQRPKPNGTCATCGGWVPGERPPSLVAMWLGTNDRLTAERDEWKARALAAEADRDDWHRCALALNALHKSAADQFVEARGLLAGLFTAAQIDGRYDWRPVEKFLRSHVPTSTTTEGET
jgi:hypothetical protein